ncbi:MAG: hypothetical protein KF850_19930 [Labilithrix sp.]|nr:hypothetical protein [Labilithrix sp.]MBX3214314.1 hypothetical protein [Labilithrix sp.]
MTPIIGLVLQALPVELTWEKDLEYFEGPVMALHRTAQREPYVETWIDADGPVSRWMLFRVTELDLIRYLFRKVTLRELILGARDGFVFVRDRGPEIQERVLFVRLEHIPEAVLPTEESFHLPTGEELASSEQAILLGAQHYEPADLANLKRVYAQVYSFASAMSPDAELTAPLKGTFKHYRFSSGYVYKNALDKIERRLAVKDRPKMLELKVASPGFMRLRVNPTLAELTKSALARFVENHDAIARAYGVIDEMVKEHARAVKEHGRTWDGLESVEAPMPEAIDALIEQLGFLDGEKIWAAGDTSVNTGRLVTTYYRRLAKLRADSESGRAEIL